MNDVRTANDLGTMICWHKRYDIGDSHNYIDSAALFIDIVRDELSPADIIAYVKNDNAKSVKLEFKNESNAWELKSYWNYTKRWYVEYTSDDPLDMADDGLSDKILNELMFADLRELAAKCHIIKPIYLYDHTIQSISTRSFIGHAQHAEWDSCQIGWIFVSHADIAKMYGSITQENISKAEEALDNEVDIYDSFFRGE